MGDETGNDRDRMATVTTVTRVPINDGAMLGPAKGAAVVTPIKGPKPIIDSPPSGRMVHHMDAQTRALGRKAELEELRRKHLAKNLRRELANGDSVPLSTTELTEFFLRQRELDKEWRRKYRDSIQYLHNYKDSSVEGMTNQPVKPKRTQLSSSSNVYSEMDSFYQQQRILNQEWKRKQMDSIAHLHNYRDSNICSGARCSTTVNDDIYGISPQDTVRSVDDEVGVSIEIDKLRKVLEERIELAVQVPLPDSPKESPCLHPEREICDSVSPSELRLSSRATDSSPMESVVEIQQLCPIDEPDNDIRALNVVEPLHGDDEKSKWLEASKHHDEGELLAFKQTPPLTDAMTSNVTDNKCVTDASGFSNQQIDELAGKLQDLRIADESDVEAGVSIIQMESNFPIDNEARTGKTQESNDNVADKDSSREFEPANERWILTEAHRASSSGTRTLTPASCDLCSACASLSAQMKELDDSVPEHFPDISIDNATVVLDELLQFDDAGEVVTDKLRDACALCGGRKRKAPTDQSHEPDERWPSVTADKLVETPDTPPARPPVLVTEADQSQHTDEVSRSATAEQLEAPLMPPIQHVTVETGTDRPGDPSSPLPNSLVATANQFDATFTPPDGCDTFATGEDQSRDSSEQLSCAQMATGDQFEAPLTEPNQHGTVATGADQSRGSSEQLPIAQTANVDRLEAPLTAPSQHSTVVTGADQSRDSSEQLSTQTVTADQLEAPLTPTKQLAATVADSTPTEQVPVCYEILSAVTDKLEYVPRTPPRQPAVFPPYASKRRSSIVPPQKRATRADESESEPVFPHYMTPILCTPDRKPKTRPSPSVKKQHVSLYSRHVADSMNMQLLECTEKWIPNSHSSRDGCERCLYFASDDEVERFQQQGHYYRITKTCGGCVCSCRRFPRTQGQPPVRLCRKCFYDTHKLGKT